MNLKKTLNRHGSDKASKHQYHLVYEPEFQPLRDKPLALLEVGVFKGDSIRAWREYFPNATIYGLDLFRRVPSEQVEAPGCTLAKGDSTTSFLNWEFDIIIDDGCHFPKVQAATLENLWKFLKPGGMYFIEDVWCSESSHPWTEKHRDDYKPENFEKLQRAVCQFDPDFTTHNLSFKTNEPDSCIIELRK